MKYDSDIDLSNRNLSHTLIVELVGWNQRVLDVGCATGYVARALVERGCKVSGMELDADAAEQARPYLEDLVVGSVEDVDLEGRFGPGSFDVVVFGDVLEHLRDPLAVLRATKPLLAPGGAIVASIPNIAHGSFRLAFLKGEFKYRPLGLLDSTHLRFFTRDTVETMFREAGLVPVEVRRTTAGLFETEITLDVDDVSPDAVRAVEQDPEATTYQFVVKAVADDAEQAVRRLHEREEAQRAEIRRLEQEVAGLRPAARYLASSSSSSSAGGREPPIVLDRAGPRIGVLGQFDNDDLGQALALRVTMAELVRRVPDATVRALTPFGRPPARVAAEGPVEPLGEWSTARSLELSHELDGVVVVGDLPAEGPAFTASWGPRVEEACPVVWSGVGLPAGAGPEVDATLAEAAVTRPYAAVTGDTAAARLHEAGAGGVASVPDPLVLVRRALTPEAAERRLAYLRLMGWFPSTGDALVVGATGDLLPHAGGLVAAFERLLARQRALALVLVDLEPGVGFSDAVTSALTSRVYRVPQDSAVDDVVATIAGASSFVSSSTVGLSLALSYRRRHVGLDLAGSGRLDAWARAAGGAPLVTAATELAKALGAAPPGENLAAVGAVLEDHLDTHFDRVVDMVRASAARRGSSPASVGPEYVEALETAYAALRRQLVTEHTAVADHLGANGAGARADAEELEELRAEVRMLNRELNAVYNTRTFRTMQPARRLYARVRGRPL